MNGRLAVVTGATGGIGTAICRTLARAEYHVVAIGRSNDKLFALSETLPAGAMTPLLLDVCAPPSHWYASLMQASAEVGTDYDLLVCAHGAPPLVHPTATLDYIAALNVLATDVGGSFLAAQTVGQYMLRRGRGCLVFVSSLHARHTYPQRTAYSMAKSAVCGLSRSLALEWGPSGLRSNCVLPWQVSGARSNAFLAAADAAGLDLAEAYRQKAPTGRLVTPADIAQTVLWLAATPSVNGAEIVLDGGVSTHMWYADLHDRPRQESA